MNVRSRTSGPTRSSKTLSSAPDRGADELPLLLCQSVVRPDRIDAALQGTIAEEKDTAFTAYPVRWLLRERAKSEKFQRYGSSFLSDCRADLMGHAASKLLFF